jgi:hypothetical protein
MKFGKRRQEVQVPGVPGVTISPPAPKRSGRRRFTGGSTAPASAPAQPVAPNEPVAVAEPVVADSEEPAASEEPVVEGEAVELPPAEPAAPLYEPPSMQHAVPTPGSMPFPVADEPVAVATPGPGPARAASLDDSGEAFASGHAAAPGPNWQEPVMELANERPELVVGAAFAGGVLVAMILRRLGN